MDRPGIARHRLERGNLLAHGAFGGDQHRVASGQPPGLLREFGRRDHRRRIGVLDDLPERGVGMARVERHEPETGLAGGDVERHAVDRHPAQIRDHGMLGAKCLAENRGQSVGRRVEFAIAQGNALVRYRRLMGRTSDNGAKSCKKFVHDPYLRFQGVPTRQ